MILTALLTGSTIWQGVISSRNNKASGEQTDKLIRAAEMNARSTAYSAAAAQDFATSAEAISSGVRDAVGKLNLQATSTKELTEQAQLQSKISQHSLVTTAHSQRAWIGLEDFHIIQFAPNMPMKVEVDFINTGLTPALDVKSGLAQVWLKPARSDASKKEEIRKARQSITLSPNEAIAPGQRVKFTLSTETPRIETGMTIFAYKDVVNGINSLYLPGRIEFKDVFDRPQWVEFCVYIYGSGSGKIDIGGCPVQESRMSYEREDR